MELGNSSVRDRLLAHLPQPENLAAYREETASLLAKQERAIFWGHKFPARVVTWLGVGVLLVVDSKWGLKLDRSGIIVLNVMAGALLFIGALNELYYRISRCKVDLLKEVKQVQLQVLELQASLRKTGSE